MDGFADPCLFEPKCGVCGRLRQRHRPTPRLGLGVRATWLGWRAVGQQLRAVASTMFQLNSVDIEANKQ